MAAVCLNGGLFLVFQADNFGHRGGFLAGFFFGLLQVNQFQRDFFPTCAICAVEADAIAFHFVLADHLVVAILEV